MSEIAQFREFQATQEAATHLGLTGPAIVANHHCIEARVERGAAQILQLLAQGKYGEAKAQMDLPNWGLEEEHHMSHFDTTNAR